VGVFFFQGTLRVPLHRFFAATSTILMVVAFQLAITGVHELSEAMWIPSSKVEMATIGPIVRNEVFFFFVILGAAALVALREWFGAKQPAAEQATSPADRRMREWEFRRQKRWSFAAATLCIAIVLSLAADFVYAHAINIPAQATRLAARDNQVRIPVSELADSGLHFYSAEVNHTVMRFLVIHKSSGEYATALDACQICGAAGYRAEGQNIICRNCAAAIYIPSIGQRGGCNPIGVKSRVEGGEVVVDLAALSDAAATIHP
jgi:high-affinity iron transporter